MQSVRNKYFKFLKKPELRGIQSTIMIVFSVISFSILLILGVVMYLSFTASARQELISGTQKLIEQAGENLEDYLVSMGRVSDSIWCMESSLRRYGKPRFSASCRIAASSSSQ